MSSKLNFRSPAVLTAIGFIATLILAVAVVMVLLLTGGSGALSDNAALIGALVALGGVLTAQMVSITLDDRRAQEARDIEERRALEARSIETQRAGEAALRSYFEDVGKLLIEEPLRRASPGDNLSIVVRAQTLAVLEGLDPDRKRILLQFLQESELIDKDKPVVSLVSANLSNANLGGLRLSVNDLSRVNLSNANLNRANMALSVLREAKLGGADLSRANLSEADLRGANLRGVTLTAANLFRTNLTAANLSGANLSGADLKYADLVWTVLSDTDLSRAVLNGADLLAANLSDADLSGTKLREANLLGANLLGAKGVTNEELEQQAKNLVGAAMPNGQKYQEWLKTKAARGERLNDNQKRVIKEYEDHLKSKGRGDGQNSGPS